MKRIATLVIATLTAAILAIPAGGAAAERFPHCSGNRVTDFGTPGDDRIKLGTADLGKKPVLATGAGDDRVILSGDLATGSVAYICGEGGDDYLVALEDTQVEGFVIDGGPGSDRMGDDSNVDSSGIGPMRLSGGPGDDVMIASEFEDRLKAGSGDDLVFALDGDDRVSGDEGDDTLFGHGGFDRVDGGDGEDEWELRAGYGV